MERLVEIELLVELVDTDTEVDIELLVELVDTDTETEVLVLDVLNEVLVD